MKLDDDANEKHEAGVVPFQSEIIDFNGKSMKVTTVFKTKIR